MSAASVAMVTNVGRKRSQAPTSTHLCEIFVLMSQPRGFESVATRGRNGERDGGRVGRFWRGRGGALGVMPSEGCNGPDDELLVPSEPPGSCRHAQLHVFSDKVCGRRREERSARFILARGLIFGSVLPTMNYTVREEGVL